MRLPLKTTPEADAQIRKIDDWWRENRPSAPNLFMEELTCGKRSGGTLPRESVEMIQDSASVRAFLYGALLRHSLRTYAAPTGLGASGYALVQRGQITRGSV